MTPIKDKISICITVKNRSKVSIGRNEFLYLFPRCIDSIVSSITENDNIEIIITDWYSTDWPLNDWLPEKLDGLIYKIFLLDKEFSKGLGRNAAADHSTGDFLFFLDTDILLNRQVILNGLNHVKTGSAYFPTCFYFLDKEHKTGFWCDGGRGICLMNRAMFLKAGKWPCPPDFNSYLNEDQVFFKKLKAKGIPVTINRERSFYHMYHPGWSVDNILRKKKELIMLFNDIK